MTIKDAGTNCLLMFVAATCVVLIVRALPQAQPQPLAQAGVLSESGKLAAAAAAGVPTPALRDGIQVYYLHGNTRCPTCETIEAYAREAVEAGFADELKRGQIAWQVVNYESPGNEHFATDYEVVAPNVVLVKLQDGQQVDWKGLPEVWEHVGDKATFVQFVQTSLRNFREGKQAVDAPDALPLPTPQSEADNSAELPIP